MKTIFMWLLGTENTTKKDAVIWNAIGGAINAGQTAIILIFISRSMDINIAGYVTIAYAIANLFLTMGKYGVRNYQVTDVKEKYSFKSYMMGRIIAIVVVLAAFGIYLLWCIKYNDYSNEKTLIIFEVTILKLIDSAEDVFLGRFQQCGRLDVGAKIMAVRMLLTTFVICIMVVVGCNIHASLISAFLISLFLDVVMIRKTFYITNSLVGAKTDKNEVKHLLVTCLPLCVGTTLSIYIGNVPKYMIDAYMNEQVQAIFGYIMMPVFVIMLLNNFIYQPMVKNLGDTWSEGKVNTFIFTILKQCLIVVGLTVIIMIFGIILGLPVLSVLYNIDLSSYQKEFTVLLLGGGFFALSSYLNVPITTIRKQRYIAVAYLIAAVISNVFGEYFVKHYEMLGAAILYLLVNIILVLSYIMVLCFGIKKKIN